MTPTVTRRRTAVAVLAVASLLGAGGAVLVGLTPPPAPPVIKALPVVTGFPAPATVGMIASLNDPTATTSLDVTHQDAVGGGWTEVSGSGWVVSATAGDQTSTTNQSPLLILTVPAGAPTYLIAESMVDSVGHARVHQVVPVTSTWQSAGSSTIVDHAAGSGSWVRQAAHTIVWRAVGVRPGEIATLTVRGLVTRQGVLRATGTVDGRPVGSVTTRVTAPPAVCTADRTDASPATGTACWLASLAGTKQPHPIPPIPAVCTLHNPSPTRSESDACYTAQTVGAWADAVAKAYLVTSQLTPDRVTATVSGPTGPVLARSWPLAQLTPATTTVTTARANAYLQAWLTATLPPAGRYTVVMGSWSSLTTKTAGSGVYASSPSQARTGQATATRSYTPPASTTARSPLPWVVAALLVLLALAAAAWLVAHRDVSMD